MYLIVSLKAWTSLSLEVSLWTGLISRSVMSWLEKPGLEESLEYILAYCLHSGDLTDLNLQSSRNLFWISLLSVLPHYNEDSICFAWFLYSIAVSRPSVTCLFHTAVNLETIMLPRNCQFLQCDCLVPLEWYRPIIIYLSLPSLFSFCLVICFLCQLSPASSSVF